ncbi:FAD-dependent oxidoreductase [Umezawaea tangerina]|uniref:NADPH-dependent dioxygenase n=1 Tax=Umezawaea tangerina TaxID=84725 RepID=A0A2T0STD7_9PSEU|nr:FAD-dependent oxidoreductase [Umezawaea tangerina]PRY36682.1 NADPH-dependent dioxygenase [Umezawaea tangerina]
MTVLIVGAGPVGLTTAHELLRRGVEVRVVDAADGPARNSRAAAMHARTIELLDQAGLYDRFDSRATQGAGIAFHVDGVEMARMNARFTTQRTRFNKVWLIDQVITEGLLRDAVTALGGRIEFGVRLTSLTEHPDRVAVSLRRDESNEDESAEFEWLVGCDGGRSTVRSQLDIRLQGDSSETWLIADAELDFATPVEHDRIRWVRADGDSMMIFPLVGERRWRLLDTVDVDHDVDGPEAAEAVAKRFSRKLSRGLGTDVTVNVPTWVSVFTIQQRAVNTMQSSRCFLAGDAAHVHSPASGQGLNTGMQDAVNLAWKLAAVIAGDAPTELLETYSSERVPVGQSLLGSTRMATMLVEMRNTAVDRALPAVFDFLKALPPVFHALEQTFIGGMSALAIAYPTSLLTVPDTNTTRPGPTAGQRLAQVTETDARTPSWTAVLAALRRPGWLLLTGPDGLDPHPLPRFVTSLPVTDLAADHLGLHTDAWLLVRPDGYVSARGNGPTRLDRTLSRLPMHTTAVAAAGRT